MEVTGVRFYNGSSARGAARGASNFEECQIAAAGVVCRSDARLMSLNVSLLNRWVCGEIVVKAILLLGCASITFGGCLRAVLPKSTVGMVNAPGAQPLERPVEELPSHSEPPVESEHIPELPEGEGCTSFSCGYSSNKLRKELPHHRRCQHRTAMSLCLVKRGFLVQFEHRFRNGCGAALRC